MSLMTFIKTIIVWRLHMMLPEETTPFSLSLINSFQTVPLELLERFYSGNIGSNYATSTLPSGFHNWLLFG